MDNVIYSVTPLQTFLTSFAMIAFFFALGVGGLGSAVFGRKQGTGARLALGAAGGVLLLAGCAMAFVMARTMNSAEQTVTVRLNDKFVAHDNCGDGGVCDRYVLEMQGGPKFYDVQVNKSAYEKAQMRGCYQLAYYPGGGLFGQPEYADTYESISSVTRIEEVDDSLCPDS